MQSCRFKKSSKNHMLDPPIPVRVPKHGTNGSSPSFSQMANCVGTPKLGPGNQPKSCTTHLGVYHLDPTATPRTLQPKLHGVFGHLIKEFLRQNLYISKKRYMQVLMFPQLKNI